MSESQKVAQRFFSEVINQRKLSVIDELVLPDVRDHNLAPGQTPGTEGLKKLISHLFEAFPDLTMDIDFIFSDGENVVCRILMRGTFAGLFLGQQGKGQKFTIDGLEVFRVCDGKIVERWANFDDLSLLKQLNIL